MAHSIQKANDNFRKAREGAFYGVSAYLIWGLFPLYFKLVAHIPPLEIVAHRVIWSVLLIIIIVSGTSQWKSVKLAISQPGTLIILSVSSILITLNWFVFMYAVSHNQLIQSSIGYFINPLISMALGFLFLRERMTKWQKVSFVIAAIGILYYTIQFNQIPWISLLLASTFSFYGLIRKTANVKSLPGLTIETFLIGTFALGYLIYLKYIGDGAFLNSSIRSGLLLPISGILTAAPLALFTIAARRLQLITVAFLQFITPSLHFFLAVFIYNEPLSYTHLFSFILIWIGLVIYSFEAIRHSSNLAKDVIHTYVARKKEQKIQ